MVKLGQKGISCNSQGPLYIHYLQLNNDYSGYPAKSNNISVDVSKGIVIVASELYR